MAKLRKQNKWCHLQIDFCQYSGSVVRLAMFKIVFFFFSFSHWGFLINIAEVANSFFLNNPVTAVENGTSCSGPRLRQGSMEYWNQRKNSPPSCPSQPIVMFSSVKKYSKKATFNKVKNSNDQNLSSFGTFQTPLPLWKCEEVSNTCFYILQRRTQLFVQWVGWLFTKYKEYSP